MNFMLKGRENTKIRRMDIVMKELGRKIYNTVMERKIIKMGIFLKENSCMEASLGKEATLFMIIKHTQDTFTMVTVMASES